MHTSTFPTARDKINNDSIGIYFTHKSSLLSSCKDSKDKYKKTSEQDGVKRSNGTHQRKRKIEKEEKIKLERE
jgi:hypothetical protein